jgi:hypothetical protein
LKQPRTELLPSGVGEQAQRDYNHHPQGGLKVMDNSSHSRLLKGDVRINQAPKKLTPEVLVSNSDLLLARADN